MNSIIKSDIDLLKCISVAKNSFGPKCNKYIGAFTTELIREKLNDSGIRVSAKDVFMRGVPIEIDLIVHREGVLPQNGILYEPEDVLVTIEVKTSGAYGEKTIQTIRQNCEEIRQANSKIKCCYITLSERKDYKWAATDANTGCETYTLFWHEGPDSKRVNISTGDWERFLLNMTEYQKQ